MNRYSSFRVSTWCRLPAFAAGVLGALSAFGQSVFFEDFESGNLNNWAIVGTQTPLTISTATNKVPTGGTYSAHAANSSDRMYATSIPAGGMGITYGSFKWTYWLHDTGNARAWSEVRVFATGNNSGSVVQVLMAGKNNNLSPAYFTNNGVAEVFDSGKYQGRALAPSGQPQGYFNLNLPGTPGRSATWHRFDIEHGTNNDGTVFLDYYVDGVLGRRLTNSYTVWGTQIWNTVYMCTGLGTTAGESYYDGFQVVQGEPWVSQQPLSATNAVGVPVSLTTAVIGLPDTIYQWRKNGANILNATTKNYSIANPQASDSGSYTLYASNQVGTTISSNAYVQVNPYNLITVPPTNLIVDIGSPASFYAEATNGVHPASTLYYQWNKNGQPIPGATGTGSSSTYSIAATTTNDHATYTVTVTNSLADPPTTSSPVTLTVNTPPVVSIPNQTATVSNLFSFIPAITDDLDIQSTPFQAFETNNVGVKVMLANSSDSGSTGNMVDTSGRSYVTNVFPAGNTSSKAYHVSWNWTNDQVQVWLRLTTVGTAVSAGGNPVINFTTPLQFDIYTDRSLNVAAGYRETAATGAVGTDSGSSAAPIEWVGVTGRGSPPTITAGTVSPGTWTTVRLSTNVNTVASFANGNDFLESPTGKGTLEHLALEPGDLVSIGQYTIYLDNFVSVATNGLQFTLDSAPPGATIDQYTGRVQWTPDTTGSYSFTVRATDTRGLTATGSFSVQVNQAVNPPGAITITQSGGNVTLNWTGSFTLQSATGVNGPYTDVNPTVTIGPYTVPATGTALFFRLRN